MVKLTTRTNDQILIQQILDSLKAFFGGFGFYISWLLKLLKNSRKKVEEKKRKRCVESRRLHFTKPLMNVTVVLHQAGVTHTR